MPTEAEIRADVLAALIERQLVTRTDAHVFACLKALSLSRAELARGFDRYRRRGQRLPPPSRTVDTALDDDDLFADPAPPPQRPSTPRREPPPFDPTEYGWDGGLPDPDRYLVADDTLMFWCSRHGDAGTGSMVPCGDFLARPDRGGRPTSWCRSCRQKYHRAQHVSVRVLENLAEVGVRFTVDDDSVIQGIACTACGQPIGPHDVAVGSTTLVHAVCPTNNQEESP